MKDQSAISIFSSERNQDEKGTGATGQPAGRFEPEGAVDVYGGNDVDGAGGRRRRPRRTARPKWSTERAGAWLALIGPTGWLRQVDKLGDLSKPEGGYHQRLRS